MVVNYCPTFTENKKMKSVLYKLKKKNCVFLFDNSTVATKGEGGFNPQFFLIKESKLCY